MNTLEKEIIKQLRALPEPLQREVLDFAGYLSQKGEWDAKDLMAAQSVSMEAVWNNPDDEVWNDL